MKKANEDIRQFIEKSGLKYYMIAHRLHLTDGNFSRLLRFELSPEKKSKILAVIEELKGEM